MLRRSIATATAGAALALAAPAAAWEPWEAVGRPVPSPLTSVTVIKLNASEVLVYGLGQDGVAYGRAHQGGQWRPWGSVGRPTASPLATVTAIATGGRRFALGGVGQDGRLYVRFYDNGRWTPWRSGGRPAGAALGSIALTKADAGINVYALGRDGQAYSRRAGEGTWTELSRPAATLLGAQLEPVIRGTALSIFAPGQDGLLYVRTRTGNAWRPWAVIDAPAGVGLSPTTPISATGADATHLTVFAAGQDGQLYRRSWNGAWAAWQAFGRPAEAAIASRPLVIASDRLVLEVAQDGRLYERTWDNPAWLALGQPAATLSTTAPPVSVTVGANRLLVLALGQDGGLFSLLSA